ncbi:MAG: hypothetical protein ACFFD4_07630 [Candidatus Odinarchaeota archaeon]
MDIRDIFFVDLCKRASGDQDIVFLTCDMGADGLTTFKKHFPDRYYNIGVMEQTGINVAAGLVLTGFKPIVYGIASFMAYRAFEQIKLNMSDMGLPITIIGSGPGLNYKSDGPTHHALYDVPIISTLPGIQILTPRDELGAVSAVNSIGNCPLYIRLGKGDYPAKYGDYIDEYANCPAVLGGV